MEQKNKTVVTVSKMELIKMLILLAKLVDMYTSVDKENKTLNLYTAIDKNDRDLDSLIALNKEITNEDELGWDYIKDIKIDDIELIIK